MKLVDVKSPHTLGGASYILFLYINSAEEVVNLLEVELYKPRIISLAADSARDCRIRGCGPLLLSLY